MICGCGRPSMSLSRAKFLGRDKLINPSSDEVVAKSSHAVGKRLNGEMMMELEMNGSGKKQPYIKLMRPHNC